MIILVRARDTEADPLILAMMPLANMDIIVYSEDVKGFYKMTMLY